MHSALQQDIREQLLKGEYAEAEKSFYKAQQAKATTQWQQILQEVSVSEEACNIVKTLRRQYEYGIMRKQKVSIVTMTGDRIQIPTWYALKKEKRRGKKKRGPNGRGDHLLLKYWGFVGKQSFNYTSRIARTGVMSQSYDLAAQELQESGIMVSGVSVNETTQRFGDTTLQQGKNTQLSKEDSFKGKRVMIAVDGGRIRTRTKKTGRWDSTQKRSRFHTNWKEPKLLVIAELDKDGKYNKGTKPLYEATMQNHDELFVLLENLAEKTDIKEAKEVIMSGDGAPWIWRKYRQLAENLRITEKSTQILDFYHATEHLNGIVEANSNLTAQESKQWFDELKTLLRAGQFNDLKMSVEKQAHMNNKSKLLKLFLYFEKNRERICYDQYERDNKPIGSGIVESAIRRVINLKLKSPSTFWGVENVEKMLHLRCILMAGRWNIMTQNLLRGIQFKVL